MRPKAAVIEFGISEYEKAEYLTKMGVRQLNNAAGLSPWRIHNTLPPPTKCVYVKFASTSLHTAILYLVICGCHEESRRAKD